MALSQDFTAAHHIISARCCPKAWLSKLRCQKHSRLYFNMWLWYDISVDINEEWCSCVHWTWLCCCQAFQSTARVQYYIFAFRLRACTVYTSLFNSKWLEMLQVHSSAVQLLFNIFISNNGCLNYAEDCNYRRGYYYNMWDGMICIAVMNKPSNKQSMGASLMGVKHKHRHIYVSVLYFLLYLSLPSYSRKLQNEGPKCIYSMFLKERQSERDKKDSLAHQNTYPHTHPSVLQWLFFHKKQNV